MPQVEIRIGGRTFEVACQDGEEPFLHAAAAMLDTEASALSSQVGRIPEAKMLLMAGLMLADKTAAMEDKVRDAETRLAEMATRESQPPETIEVAVVPVEVTETLAELAARAEALAAEVEARIAG